MRFPYSSSTELLHRQVQRLIIIVWSGVNRKNVKLAFVQINTIKISAVPQVLLYEYMTSIQHCVESKI